MARDTIYFISQNRHGVWRVRTVVEHGPYHSTRPANWRGPYASELDAHRAIVAVVTARPTEQHATLSTQGAQ